MKKLILLTTTLFLSYVSYGQSVNGKPLSEVKTPYCQIVGTSKLFSNKLIINIDFGQENKFWDSSDDGKIIDENGKSFIFNSMVDALNFMIKNGYEFVTAYTVTLGNQNVYHYLLRKTDLTNAK